MSVHCTCPRHYIIVLVPIFLGGMGFFLKDTSEWSRPTGLCTEPEIVSPTLSGLLYSLCEIQNMDWEDDRGIGGGGEDADKKIKKRRRIPGSFWWSCFRLHNYSIWCAICDSWMFLVYLCSLHPTREKKTRRVTRCYNNAIDLVLILFNIISINNCCLPPSERPLVFSLFYIWAWKTTNSIRH